MTDNQPTGEITLNALHVYEEAKRRIEERVHDQKDEVIVSLMDQLTMQITLKKEQQRLLDEARREIAELRFKDGEEETSNLINRVMMSSRTEGVPVQ